MSLRPMHHLVLSTLIGGTLLVTAATGYWNFVFFPPRFRGWGEVTPNQMIAGWAINRNDPSTRVQVQLYIDDRFVAYGLADLPRPDVVEAGWTQEPRCGYGFPIPPMNAGEHEARVYSLHKVRGGTYVTMQMTGNPIRFVADRDGTVRSLK